MQDARQDSNFIALSKAVVRAHRRLFPYESSEDPRTLAVIALALSYLIPMYWRDARTGARHQLTEPELSATHFTGAVLEVLSVPKLRFEATLDTLQVASLEQARASLTLRQSPRAARETLKKPQPVEKNQAPAFAGATTADPPSAR